jgi:hypothetical protein
MNQLEERGHSPKHLAAVVGCALAHVVDAVDACAKAHPTSRQASGLLGH